MKKSNIKSTVLLVILLIVICGGSFFAVRLVNKIENPAPTHAPVPSSTLAAVITDAPTSVTSVMPDTLPLESLSAGVSKEAKPSKTEKETKKEKTTKEKNTTVITTADLQTTVADTTTDIDVNNIEVNSAEDAEKFLDRFASDVGLLGFKYNDEGKYFYTAKDPWQRNFGFNRLYDVGAQFVIFYYDTMRCKFRYNDMDYMMQFWKGQYGLIFLGTEIGLYYKPIDRRVNHYDCVSDKDSLKMQMDFYRKGELKASTPYKDYWWCTAFVPGKLDQFSDRSELELRARITMKDKKMLDVFEASLIENGMKKNADYKIDGLDVFIIY